MELKELWDATVSHVFVTEETGEDRHVREYLGGADLMEAEVIDFKATSYPMYDNVLEATIRMESGKEGRGGAEPACFTYDDYVEAMAEGMEHEFMSEEWKAAVKKRDTILEALLWQEETRAQASAEIADAVMTMAMMGQPRTDAEVIHGVWLLEQAGTESDLAKVRELVWKEA